MKTGLLFFRLNRVDAILWFAACWTILTAYVYGGGWLTLTEKSVWGLIACSCWAIGGAAGCRQIHYTRAGILVALQIVFFFLILACFQFQRGLELTEISPSAGLSQTGSNLFHWLAIALIAFGVHWLLSLLIDRTTKYFSGTDQPATSRIDALIQIGVLLMFGHWFSSLTESVTATLQRGDWGAWIRVGIASYVLTNALTGRWSWLFFWIALPALAAAGVFRIFFEPQFMHIVLAAVVLVVALIAIGSGRRRGLSVQPGEPVRSFAIFPSVGGLVPLAIVVLFAVSPSWINLPTLCIPGKADLWTRFVYARETGKSLQAFQAVAHWEDRFPIFVIDFADRTADDRLETAMQKVSTGEISLMPYTTFLLRNLHPNVQLTDFSQSFLRLEHGTVTTDQMNELGNAQGLWLKNLDIQLGTSPWKAKSVLMIDQCSPAQLENLFRHLDRRSNVPRFQFVFPITKEYWPIVLCQGNQITIYFFDLPEDEFLTMICGEEELTTRIVYPISLSIPKLVNYPEIILRDVLFSVSLEDVFPFDSELEAILAFYRGESQAWPQTLELKATKRDVHELLVFERGSNGEPKGLFVPWLGDINIDPKGLESIETVSFDLRWLHFSGTNQFRINNRQLDLDFFSQLPQIKRIDFPFRLLPIDLTQVKQLRQLEELSIPLSALGGLEELRHWPELKKVRLVGGELISAPSRVAELGLNNLESIELGMRTSDLENESVRTETERIMKALFPQAEIVLIDSRDQGPDVPESFQEHLKVVRQRLYEKLKAGGER